jgi:hypothetical protein
MREPIKNFVRIVARDLPICGPVYEFGALQVPGQESFGDLRPFFAGKEYIGCDMRAGLGVDKVVNLHKIELPDGVAGTVLVLDTLEHVEFVRKAIEEIWRITAPGGMAVVSSPMNFPIHTYPCDYWRFTPEGLKSPLAIFDQKMVTYAGPPWFPHTVVGVGFKNPVSEEFAGFEDDLARWQTRWREKTGNRWVSLVRYIAPAALFETRRRWQWTERDKA